MCLSTSANVFYVLQKNGVRHRPLWYASLFVVCTGQNGMENVVTIVSKNEKLETENSSPPSYGNVMSGDRRGSFGYR